ncbi:MAG: phosphoribosylformimino-5-aminoimidazole carboxamide ribotide isomerase [Pseudomonadota bacterium]
MKFRPCIDIHDGVVKQIVGSTLSDEPARGPVTNFASEKSPGWFALKYRQDNLTGGHVIQLGKGNEASAREALAAWPGGMQIGGGISLDNAVRWLDDGAAAVIVTSWVFHRGTIHMERLESLVKAIGKERLVLDLSCRKKEGSYRIVTDRWQTFARETVTMEFLDRLSSYCFEFLIHAVDVEGKCSGIETPLVELLGKWQGIPVTYAGGIQSMDDIRIIETLGRGAIDFTVGSALDIFGGDRLAYDDLAARYAPVQGS